MTQLDRIESTLRSLTRDVGEIKRKNRIDQKKVLSVKEVLQRFQVSRSTLVRYRREGRLPAIKKANSYCYAEEELEKTFPKKSA